MAGTYFVLLAIIGFEALRDEVGYARSLRLVDALARDVARVLPATNVRANRESVEFCLEASSADAAQAALAEARNALAREIGVRGGAVTRTVAFAAVPCPGGRPSERLVRKADALLERARREGVGVLLVEQAAVEHDDDRLVADLRAAIEADALMLHYQPKMRARTGAIVGSEALVRWHHPSLGAISPERFVAAAERSGDIRALTRWVARRAAADQEVLTAAGLRVPTMINLSAPLLAEARFADAILEFGVEHAGTIGFEITETAKIADSVATLDRLRAAADAGVRLAIDDYGSGFSSLAYLQQLPVRELKIDRMFITGLTTSARDPLLVRSTIDLAHALEMDVTAEGVESAGALALLQVMGCDLVQGFLISAALPLDQLVGFVRAAGGSALPRPATLRERLASRRARAGEEA